MQLYILVGLVALVCGVPAPFGDPMMNEGDIMGIDSAADRSTILKESKKWPGAIIPYVISDERKPIEELIFKAMDHISDHTCIRFVKRTTEKDYVKIVKGDSCWSHAGRVGFQQLLSIGEGCDSFLNIVCTLMYATGSNHEQQRPDRDEYVTVHWDNIERGLEYQFRKDIPGELKIQTPFDENSITLYDSFSFAKDPSKPTITFKDGRKIVRDFDRQRMSVWDARKLNILYNCPA